MIEFIKKWFNRENWKLSVALIFIGFLSIYTLCITYSYFNRNEIFWGISDKYVTTKNDSIMKENDSIKVKNIFNNTVKEKTNLNDSTKIFVNTNQTYPTDQHILKNEKESFELGDIGDFIGGYFGFLIGVIGALLTFLAFYIQYKANKDVQKQFGRQQFETQFHKMIDVYLNNKDKFSIIGYKNIQNKPIDLLQIPVANLNKKLNVINEFYSNQNITFIEFTTKDHIVFQKFLVELKVIYRVFLEAYKEKLSITEEELDKSIKEILFKEAYSLFFNGLNQYCKKNKIELNQIDRNEKNNNLKSIAIDDFSFEQSISDLYEKFITRIESFNKSLNIKLASENLNPKVDIDLKIKAILLLNNLKNIHKKNGTKVYENFYHDGIKNKTLWLKLNYTPFNGYLHFLPQYYRNLYSIVKYVVTDNPDLNLTTNEKSKYLRILRSTMSEHEQTLLFYNWLSDTGSEWENHENNFLSDWKMIDNLNDLTLIDKDFKFEDYLKKSN